MTTRATSVLRPHPDNQLIYGDQPDPEFIRSVTDKGILEPLLVTDDDRIISGHRRWRAAQQVGLDQVPVSVFGSQDELLIREALIVANKQRTKTNEQLAREAKALLDIEKERAARRQRDLAGTRPNQQPDLPAKCPEGPNPEDRHDHQDHQEREEDPERGDARDLVGRQLGVSGKTVDKAVAVVGVIDHLRETAQENAANELRASLNDKSLHAAHKLAKERGHLVSLPVLQAEGGEGTTDPIGITLPQWEAMSAEERRAVLTNIPTNSGSGFNRQQNDSIEWALWSWNPVTGCRHSCSYCYARDIAERLFPTKFDPTFHPDRLKAPHTQKVPKDAAQKIGLKNVFCCSMADLFGGWVPQEWIEAVLTEVRAAPQWNFLFLTKYPQRLSQFEFPPNAWVGTTVDRQALVANAEAAFRNVHAAVKWLSCEPLLEPLHFTDLSLFQWLVIGGASKSNQTPEFRPPRSWVNDLEQAARQAGCAIYEKDNLLERIREYPGTPTEVVTAAPEAFKVRTPNNY